VNDHTADLVAQLRQGDTAAFEEAYRRYGSRIYNFLIRLSRDRCLAEDLLQETWLRLARNALLLDEQTNLAAWLFSVARNLFVSHQRWQKITFERLQEWLRFREPATPYDLCAADQTERYLEEALGRLQTANREIILLVCVEGLTPLEAAEVIGISPESARQRLSRARKSLAKSFADAENRSPLSRTGIREPGSNQLGVVNQCSQKRPGPESVGSVSASQPDLSDAYVRRPEVTDDRTQH